jgi:WD40 repeat protein
MTPVQLELGSHCAAARFLGDTPLFALADGTIHRWKGADESERVHAALLAAAASNDRQALLTSGDDGRVCRVERAGAPVELANLPRKWIASVACSALGPVAFASGRTVWLHGASSELRELQHPRSVAGIAFSPEGSRVAVARYNGVTLHWLFRAEAPVELEYKGIHTGLTFSPDGRFLVAAMQENFVHGWRLADGQHFRMTGYPAKVKDWAWSASERWLATSGGFSAVVWPFDGPHGPIGRNALEIGPRAETLVTAVACHPREDTIAIGYADGALKVAPIEAEGERLLRAAGRGAITSIDWHRAGDRLAFGSNVGECGVLDVPA